MIYPYGGVLKVFIICLVIPPKDLKIDVRNTI
jgi:hypothetical protein